MAFPRLTLFALLTCIADAARAASTAARLQSRTTNHFVFKGQKIPTVNWTSPDIYNFTWGLTGVNNYENFDFGYGFASIAPL